MEAIDFQERNELKAKYLDMNLVDFEGSILTKMNS